MTVLYLTIPIYLKAGSSETVPGGKLVLNGGEIKAKGNGANGSVIKACTAYSIVEINGGKVTDLSEQNTIYPDKTTTLKISDAVVTGKTFSYAGQNSTAGSVTVNNSTFNGQTCFYGSATVNNSTFNGSTSFSGSATVNDTTFNGVATLGKSSHCKGCTFNDTVKTGYGKTVATIVEDSVINGDFQTNESNYKYGQLKNCTVNGTVYSSAEKISGENSKFANRFDVGWLEKGKTLTSTKNSEGYYTIRDLKQEDCVATLTYGGAITYYRTVDEAVEAGKNKENAVVTVIKDGSTGTLQASYVNKVVVNKGVTFTITGSIVLSKSGVSERCVFENNGTTIIGSSIYNYSDPGSGYFVNNGTLTVGYISIATANNKNNGTISFTSTTSPSKLGSGFVNNGMLNGENDKVKLNVETGNEITTSGQSGTAYDAGVYTWNSAADKFILATKGIVKVIDKETKAETFYLSVEEAIEKAGAGDTLQIMEDLSNLYITINKELTIDLNGHTLSYSNSSGTTSGQITITGTGKLTIKDSTANTSPVINDNGTVTYNAGRIKCSAIENNWPTIMVKSGGHLTVESGIIEAVSENYAICIADDANPANKKGAENSVVTINGGLVMNSSEKANSHAIGIYGTSYGADTYGKYQDSDPKLVITGGIVWANTGYAIVGQGTLNNTNIEISGGTITSKETCAIYHPQYGKMSISGGTITGKSAICVKGGEITISGGTLTATDTEKYSAPESAGSSGTYITGDALYIEDNYNRGIVVAITGGEFKTTGESTVACRVLFSQSKAATVTVNGTITTPNKETGVVSEVETTKAVS